MQMIGARFRQGTAKERIAPVMNCCHFTVMAPQQFFQVTNPGTEHGIYHHTDSPLLNCGKINHRFQMGSIIVKRLDHFHQTFFRGSTKKKTGVPAPAGLKLIPDKPTNFKAASHTRRRFFIVRAWIIIFQAILPVKVQLSHQRVESASYYTYK